MSEACSCSWCPPPVSWVPCTLALTMAMVKPSLTLMVSPAVVSARATCTWNWKNGEKFAVPPSAVVFVTTGGDGTAKVAPPPSELSSTGRGLCQTTDGCSGLSVLMVNGTMYCARPLPSNAMAASPPLSWIGGNFHDTGTLNSTCPSLASPSTSGWNGNVQVGDVNTRSS